MNGFVMLGDPKDLIAPLGQQCEAADTRPQIWGHKCVLQKGHKRTDPHMCGCFHTWIETRGDG